MKWVLVTGGNGFIGTNLCKRLLKEGKSVIVVDNTITSDKNRKDIFSQQKQYRFFYHDIVEAIPRDLLPENISIETIYHLACPTGVPNLLPLAQEMALTCSIGTRNVLELAKLHNADVIFTSSSEVYGDPEIFPQDERYTGNVPITGIRSPYEEGKRFSETLIQVYARKYNLRTKIIRVFNTYGPYMFEKDTRVIPRFIQQLKGQQPLTIQGDGKSMRTFCYVDDLIEGIRIIQTRGKDGEVYNLGSDEEISIFALAQKMLTFTKNQTYVFLPQVVDDHHRRLPSLTKVKKLGWQMTKTLDEGVEQTIKWYGLSAL